MLTLAFVRHRQYRAPELFFSPRTYDAPALDLWALGTTLAEFFTPIERVIIPVDDYSTRALSTSFEGMWAGSGGARSRPKPKTRARRKWLFDPEGGDISLVGDFFKLLGTPDTNSWPASLSSFSQAQVRILYSLAPK
jgi:serine/threonine protein kinase